MTIVMNQKIREYMEHPSYFQLDLQRQLRQWMANVVRPLGSHYEASRAQIERVKQLANNRRQEQQQRLERIRMYQDIAMGICFMAVDVIAAGAVSNVRLLEKRFSSQRDFQHFRDSTDTFEAAWRQFNAQSNTIVDSILADADSKIRGLASTSSVQSAATTIRSLTSDITASIPAVDQANFAGPQQFQNNLTNFYSSVCDSINDVFVNLVRDGNGDAAFKRRVLEILVNLPFCRPPTLSLDNFAWQFRAFFELTYWCRLIAGTANGTPGRTFGLIEGYLADAINQRVLYLTNHIFTHRGGEVIPGSNVRRTRDQIELARTINGVDLAVRWDGYCSRAHDRFGRRVLDHAREHLIHPLFVAQGMSSANTHGAVDGTGAGARQLVGAH